MQEVKLWFARTFYPVALYWWMWWSKTYRFFFNRKYKDTPIIPYFDITNAMRDIMRLDYKPDGWRQLWDVCSSPQYVQDTLNYKKTYGLQPEGPMDCDEYAVWCANALHGAKYDAKIMTVAYVKPDGKLGGHAVCLLMDESTGKYHHVGNWNHHGPFDFPSDAVNEILSIKKTDKLVGYALFSKDLKLLKYKRG